MNLGEVRRVLDESFQKKTEEGIIRNIIFWYDEEGEFKDDLQGLNLSNAKSITLTSNNAFYIKHLLEREDLESNYLIYSPKPRPAVREDWLLDIFRYSREFSTDKATLIMRDLGAEDTSLRHVFKRYLKFFNNKERYQKFVAYNISHYTEESVDAAVLSALCKLPAPNIEQALKRVLVGEADNDKSYKESIDKFGDESAFWRLVQSRYGFPLKDQSLEDLFISLAVTHLNYTMDKIPKSWQQLLSPKNSDCVVFISNFMSHSADSKFYDRLADKAETTLKIKDYIHQWDVDMFIESDTFRIFDMMILMHITSNLLEGIGEFDRYKKLIDIRRTKHWFPHYKHEYEMLYSMIDFFKLDKELAFVEDSIEQLAESYSNESYLMDQLYRKINVHYDKINDKELFGAVMERVENIYSHSFLDELSIQYTAAVGSLEEYDIPRIPNQKDFYNKYVSPFVLNGDRLFVIISDGLRYEAGAELRDILSKSVRGQAKIEHMLGVVPSTTRYGMASLLPYDSIELNDKGELTIDGVSSQGTMNREKILLNHCSDALAIAYKDMADMKREDYKETFTGKKLIYIYHNIIDAVGDKSQTERDVFNAVEQAFQEILQLVKNLVNYVSASNVLITSDHGFIYRRSPLTEIDKIDKAKVPMVEAGRRFILASGEEEIHDTVSISMSYLLGGSANLKAFTPKGIIRYKTQGPGTNYVHGGASLQETIIPVLKYKNSRKEEFKVKKVEVKLTNISRRITNRITFLEFFQTEKADEKKLPRRLKLYFEDKEGNRLSNENIIIADSKSIKPEDRLFKEKFTLKDAGYDKTKDYYLMLEDEEEKVEKVYKRIPFVIDLLITNDFGL